MRRPVELCDMIGAGYVVSKVKLRVASEVRRRQDLSCPSFVRSSDDTEYRAGLHLCDFLFHLIALHLLQPILAVVHTNCNITLRKWKSLNDQIRSARPAMFAMRLHQHPRLRMLPLLLSNSSRRPRQQQLRRMV